MDWKSAECPISREPAQGAIGTGDYHHYDCPTCGRFDISRSAHTAIVEKNLYDMPQCVAALKEAKRKARRFKIPVVESYDFY